jgi:hypothetical protein
VNRAKVQAQTVRDYDGSRPCLPIIAYKTLFKVILDPAKGKVDRERK